MTETLISVPRLDTPRLTLRPLTMGDAADITAGIGNYDVARWLSSVPYPYAHQDALNFIAREGGQAMVWGIEHEGALVGVVSIRDELGFWLARPVWGKGLGFEAARAAVQYWFSQTEHTSLVSGHFLDNHRSGLVLRSLGFKPTDIVPQEARALSQDVLCQKMRLTRADWQQRETFEVRTQRLKLRPLIRTDARALQKIATPEVAYMVTSIPSDFTLAEAKAFINKRRWQGYPGFLLAIEDQSGDVVGCIGCGGQPVTAMVFFGRDHWGKRYASEASSAFVAELFKRFPLSAIHAEHFADNPASGGIVKRLGFTRLGTQAGESKARLEPAPIITYALTRDRFFETQ
ncbi:MAG: GNAT family N-acetyltransferase [Pseudomonadota bacterium]